MFSFYSCLIAPDLEEGISKNRLVLPQSPLCAYNTMRRLHSFSPTQHLSAHLTPIHTSFQTHTPKSVKPNQFSRCYSNSILLCQLQPSYYGDMYTRETLRRCSQGPDDSIA